MPASDLKTAFQVIQEGYPRSDIVIRSFTEGIPFSHMGLDLLHDLSEQSDIYTAVALKQREYYRFQLGLSGDLQLFMLVEKEYVPDPDEVLYRLLILKSEVPVKLSFNDRLPFPEKYLFFMDQLLNKYTPANASMLYQLAAECGVDTRCHRVICLIRAESDTEPDRRMGNTSVRRLIEALRSKNLITESDIVYSENEKELIIIKRIDPEVSIHRQLREELFSIRSAAAELMKSEVRIGISSVMDAQEQYQQNLRKVRTLLSAVHGEALVFASEQLLTLMLEYTPAKTLEHYLGIYAEAVRRNPSLLETMRSLIENNMNLNQAAQKSHMHRNTMLLHARELRDVLHLDPFNRESDRLTVEVLYRYYCNY